MQSVYRRTGSLLWVCAMLCALSVACARNSEPQAPAVDESSRRVLPAGMVVGTAIGESAQVWLGIPYAKSPVGQLRWRAPEPLPSWEGELAALESGSPCVQFPMPLGDTRDPNKVIGREDCLFLNVYAPRHDAAIVPSGDERYPVMVWIHGGANLTGETATYDWSAFAAKHDVVVVGMNYRLGPFGWFRHEALVGPGDDAFDRSGNFGTLDLIRSLEWVQENVSAFGGDASNVTIFGESAGGNNVITLLLSEPAKGLFHRAISQSGGTWSASVAEAENWSDDEETGRPFSAREYLAALLVEDGTVGSRAEAKQYVEEASANQIEVYLRGQTPASIMRIIEDRKRVTMSSMPLTIRGGVVVPEGEMIDAFARGDFARVPMILGTNRDESKLFLMMDPEYTRNFLGLMPRIRDETRFERDAQYASAAWKADGADLIAMEVERHEPGSIFGYRFDWDEEPVILGTDFGQVIGAAHGLEIPFVMGFDGLDLGPITLMLGGDETAAGRLPLSNAMGDYWAAFAKSGDPGRGREAALPTWTAWDSSRDSSPRFMVFDTERDGGLRMSAKYQTPHRIAEDISVDSRFETLADRCEAIGKLVLNFPQFSAEDASRHGC